MVWVDGEWVPAWRLPVWHPGWEPEPVPRRATLRVSWSVLNREPRRRFTSTVAVLVAAGTYPTPTMLEVADAVLDWRDDGIKRFLRSDTWADMRRLQLET